MYNKKVVVYDYGSGNYESIFSCVKKINYNVDVSNKISELKKADLIILPGVANYITAMKTINKNNKNKFLDLIKKGKKVLGICLGMQLLTKSSTEIKKTDGLKIISAETILNTKGSHIGWNSIFVSKKSIYNCLNNKIFYFQHDINQ